MGANLLWGILQPRTTNQTPNRPTNIESHKTYAGYPSQTYSFNKISSHLRAKSFPHSISLFLNPVFLSTLRQSQLKSAHTKSHNAPPTPTKNDATIVPSDLLPPEGAGGGTVLLMGTLPTSSTAAGFGVGGMSVGFSVSGIDGDFVGPLLGLTDGDLVGDTEGLRVGGDVDGLEEGSGDTVGDVEGGNEGDVDTVGVEDGAEETVGIVVMVGD